MGLERLSRAVSRSPSRVPSRGPADGVSDITSIFADGTDGFYYNFSTLTKLWKDTSATTPVASAGDSIARADDSSPRGRNATQATASAQPKYQTGGLARFDGVDDNLLSTLAPGAAMTLAFRGVMPSVASTKIIMGAGSATGACYIGLRLETTSTVLCAGVGSQASSTVKAAADIAGATGTGVLTVDGSLVRLFWEGVKVYEAAQVGAIGTDIAVRLGALNGSTGTASLFVNADISKALAIKKALTAAQIAAITNLWGTS